MDQIATARANALISAVTAQRNDGLNRAAELTADLLASQAQVDELARGIAERDKRVVDLERALAASTAALAKTPGAVDLTPFRGLFAAAIEGTCEVVPGGTDATTPMREIALSLADAVINVARLGVQPGMMAGAPLIDVNPVSGAIDMGELEG